MKLFTRWAEAGELIIDDAIDDHDAGSCEFWYTPLEIVRQHGQTVGGRAERQLGQLAVRRVPPRFVAFGGKPDAVEQVTGGRRGAHRHDEAPASGRSGASLSSVLTKSA